MLLRPALQLADYLGPVFAAIVFIVIMSQVKEPARHNYNAIFLAGASGVYMNGGLGLWELLYVAIAGGVVAYLALRSYYALGLGWLMHACWDLVRSHSRVDVVTGSRIELANFGCQSG